MTRTLWMSLACSGALSVATTWAMDPTAYLQQSFDVLCLIEKNDQAGLEEIVKKVDVNTRYLITCNMKYTLLGNKELMTFLVNKGADLSAQSLHQDPPLIMLVKQAVRAHTAASCCTGSAESAMWQNVIDTCVASIEHLVTLGADLNITNHDNESALYLALCSETLAIKLLELGADANGLSKFKEEPLLHLATAQGKTTIVQKLLERGARIDVAGRRGGILKYAYVPEIIALLKQHGAKEDRHEDLSLKYSGT